MMRAHLPRLGILSLLLCLGVSATLLSCSDNLAQVSPGEISVSPPSVTLPSLTLGEQFCEELRIRNVRSDGDLVVFSIAWEGSEDINLVFNVDPGGLGEPEFTLEPDSEYLFAYCYTAAAGVTPGGTVVIESNDPDALTTRISISPSNDQPEIRVIPSREEGLEFSPVQPGNSDIRFVSINNFGNRPLSISQITLDGTDEIQVTGATVKAPNAGDVTVELPLAEAVVLPDSSTTLELQLTYAPTQVGGDLGRIIIENDDPDEEDSPYILPIDATSSTPCIRLTPGEVEFTDVLVGTNATQSVSIVSCGGVPLTLNGIRKEAGGTDEITVNEATPIAGTILQPSESIEIEVSYVPLDVGPGDAAVFFVASDDPLQPEARLQVLGTATANQCPQADARASIAGDVVSPTDQLLAVPLDTIILDGSLSNDPDGGEIMQYEWSVRQRPSDSTSQIEIRGGSEARYLADLAGTYEFCLDVIDNAGVRSCNTDCVLINVRPTDKILIELTWTTPSDMIIGDDFGTDLDLHFMRLPYGSWALTDDPNRPPEANIWDVFFGNQMPVWPIPGEVPETPTLDVDDKNGDGPENISLNNPNACAWFAVGVHYFEDEDSTITDEGTLEVFNFGPVSATIRIFVNGSERGIVSNLPLLEGDEQTGDFWYVALLHWDGNTGRVFEIREQYRSGTWKGTFPRIPDDAVRAIERVAPQCAGQGTTAP